MIHRDLLKTDFTIEDVTYDKKPITRYNRSEFCDLIDAWKEYLYNEHGLGKGSIVGLGIVNNTAKSHALTIACGEMGIAMVSGSIAMNPDILTDGVVNRLEVDLCCLCDITSKFLGGVQPVYVQREIDGHGGAQINIDEVNIEEYFGEEEPPEVELSQDDLAYITWSDGREEDTISFQYWSHKEVLAQAHRTAILFKMNGTTGIHTFNLCHCDSFMNYMLPAYISCEKHIVMNFWDRAEAWKPFMIKKMMKHLNTNQQKVFMIKNHETFKLLLENMSQDAIDSTLFVYPKGYVDEELHGLVQVHDAKIVVMSGDNRAKAFFLFVRYLTKTSPARENNVGKVIDNFYTLVYNSKNKLLMVSGIHDKTPTVLPHHYEKQEDGSYVKGKRINEHFHTGKVEEILGHTEFDIFTKYGRSYLVSYQEMHQDQYDECMTLGFKSVKYQSRLAYCVENLTDRYWFNLKEQFRVGFDNYEKRRTRYRDE